MNIQSWMIKSWTAVDYYLSQNSEVLPRFLHAGTHLRDDGATSGLRTGDTIWLLRDSHQPAGLAWEWVEVRPGVVMLADPNVMITNLRLIDNQQQDVLGMQLLRLCNRIVHQLGWQAPVQAQLASHPARNQVQIPLPLPLAIPPRTLQPLPPAPQLASRRLQDSPRRRHMLTRACDFEGVGDPGALRRAA